MLHQQQLSARTENPLRLADRGAVVRDGAEGEGEDNGVEGLVGKIHGLCVADPQVGLPPELVRSLASDVEHWSAEIDAGQADVRWIVGKVPTGTDADVQNFALRLRAHPLASSREEHCLEKLDVLVIPGCQFRPDAADAFGFGRDRGLTHAGRLYLACPVATASQR